MAAKAVDLGNYIILCKKQKPSNPNILLLVTLVIQDKTSSDKGW
jgi:hypothetical protein